MCATRFRSQRGGPFSSGAPSAASSGSGPLLQQRRVLQLPSGTRDSRVPQHQLGAFLRPAGTGEERRRAFRRRLHSPWAAATGPSTRRRPRCFTTRRRRTSTRTTAASSASRCALVRVVVVVVEVVVVVVVVGEGAGGKGDGGTAVWRGAHSVAQQPHHWHPGALVVAVAGVGRRRDGARRGGEARHFSQQPGAPALWVAREGGGHRPPRARFGTRGSGVGRMEAGGPSARQPCNVWRGGKGVPRCVCCGGARLALAAGGGAAGGAAASARQQGRRGGRGGAATKGVSGTGAGQGGEAQHCAAAAAVSEPVLLHVCVCVLLA